MRSLLAVPVWRHQAADASGMPHPGSLILPLPLREHYTKLPPKLHLKQVAVRKSCGKPVETTIFDLAKSQKTPMRVPSHTTFPIASWWPLQRGQVRPGATPQSHAAGSSRGYLSLQPGANKLPERWALCRAVTAAGCKPDIMHSY